MRTILVVAKEARQFHQRVQDVIAKFEGPTTEVEYKVSQAEARIGDWRYIYVGRPEQMIGFRGVDVEFWGSWHTLPRGEIAEFQRRAEEARGT